MNKHLALGMLSGTSIDGIDVVLADFSGAFPKIVATHSHPYPAVLRKDLLELSSPSKKCIDLTFPKLLEFHRQLAEVFAEAATTLIAEQDISVKDIACLGFHGQTIAHQPLATPPWTLQLGDPMLLSQLTKITVISGFRSSDMAAGGQGAPLAPLLHKQLFQNEDQATAVINIGGISNITLPDGSGFDTGPGNCLLDAWIWKCQQQKFDQHGAWADTGLAQDDLLDAWLADKYFKTSSPKSTGTDYFNLEWVSQTCDLTQYRPEDIQASLAELSARSIAAAVPVSSSRLLVCGGGAHNIDLLNRIQQQLTTTKVSSTLTAGVDPDWVEGLLFAWLGWQRLHKLKIDTRIITGASKPLLAGAIYTT